MPEGVPPMVSQAFISLIPSTAVIILVVSGTCGGLNLPN